jgi:lipopolysaccharide export system permease protein
MRGRRPTLGAVGTRYLIGEFLGLFVPILLSFVLLFLIIDFFERLHTLLENDATLSAAVRYFAFKIPLMVTLVLPAAGLVGTLLSIGMLSRRNEIIALRASGVSLLQMALPLLAAAAAISVAALLWNETVVPYCAQRFEEVNVVEIRKREKRGILSEREIWYHGVNGFYHIDLLDPRRQTLFGLTIYKSDPDFQLDDVTEIDSAQWTGTGWRLSGAVERRVSPTGDISTHTLPPDAVVMSETINDFLDVHRDPEELSYLDLRRRVAELTRKGIDASPYRVDLNMKLAVPFTTFVLAAVAIPLAGRVRRHPSIAAVVGIGFVIGFAYWVLLGLTNSLGLSGALPPAVSAWAANIVFLLIGVALFLSQE